MAETPSSRFPAEAVAHWARETPTRPALRSVARDLPYAEMNVGHF